MEALRKRQQEVDELRKKQEEERKRRVEFSKDVTKLLEKTEKDPDKDNFR